MGTLIWFLLYLGLGAANAVLWSGFAANAVLHSEGKLGGAALWGWLVMLGIGLLLVPLIVAVRIGQARVRKHQPPNALRALFQVGFWFGLAALAALAVITHARPDALFKDGVALLRKVGGPPRDDRAEVERALVAAYRGHVVILTGRDPGPEFAESITNTSAIRLACDMRDLLTAGSLIGGLLKPELGAQLKDTYQQVDKKYGLDSNLLRTEIERKLGDDGRGYLRDVLAAYGTFVESKIPEVRKLDPSTDAKRLIDDAILRDAQLERVSPTQMRVRWLQRPNEQVPPVVDAFLEDGKWRIDLR